MEWACLLIGVTNCSCDCNHYYESRLEVTLRAVFLIMHLLLNVSLILFHKNCVITFDVHASLYVQFI